jgi:hypothetical protein
MEEIKRDSFIVYRSYWEGLKLMDKDVQCEVYNAIMEYGFTGNVPDLSPTAEGIFILMKPNIDVSLTRYKNGRKGGNISASKRTVNKVNTKQMTYDDEIKEMLENKQWNEPVCMQLKINSEEFKQRISEFSTHLKCTMDGVGHDSIGDAHRHFISWMHKKYPPQTTSEEPSQPDYTYNGGFGGQDV